MSSVVRSGQIAMTAAVLGLVVWRLGTGPFVDGVRAVDARTLAIASGVGLLTTVCCAWRWTIVARGLGARLSVPAAVAAYYRSLFLNLILPGGVAGDVHRAVAHGRDVRDVRLAAKAVVWERAAGQLVQGLMTIAVLAIVPSPVRSSMPFVALALVAAAIGIVVFDRVLAAGAWWRRARRAVAADVRAGLLHGQVVWAVAFASAVVVLGHAVTFLVAARSAGVTAPASRLFPLALLALLGMVLPSVAGWGPREGVTAWVFASAGLGASRGVATAVAYGVLVLAASLPGALVLAGTWLPGLRLAPFPGRASSGVRPKGVTDA